MPDRIWPSLSPRYRISIRLEDFIGLASLNTKNGSAIRGGLGWTFAICCWALFALELSAADYDEAVAAFRTGDFAKAEKIAAAEVERGVWSERWPVLLIECQLTTGQYAGSLSTYQNAKSRYPSSIVLRRLGLDSLRQNGLVDEAEVAEAELQTVMQRSMRGYISRDNLIAAGRYLADKNEDARKILEIFYDRVRDRDPDFLEAYIATAELAIAKGDNAVAAETMREAAKLNVDDPRIDLLLAKSLKSSDAKAASVALNRAMSINPKLAGGLQMLAETAIDQERYDESEKIISQMLSVNLHDRDAWALLAVLAHLRGHYEIELLMRAAALSTWPSDPSVDHLIGKKLSQKYRFAEGARYQRNALEMDPEFMPAMFALAEDLLRLGDDDVGWQLADEVTQADPYNVVAYNLLNLKDEISSYTVLERDGIRVAMERQEADVYGLRVLDLLSEAKTALCAKYEVTIDDSVSVEIFQRQSDFAIRTFGLPGGDGYLGVCFGRVITANSPASQGPRPSNWQSVLWHEFCHTVTLEKTRNRMPRWLSEGISVYEERQRNSNWGESITPTYREMLLSEQRTPVSDLSAAFLNPPSPLHLQFAYYHSSLVVEFIIDRHGMDSLLAILDDLGAGLRINDALTRHAGSLARLDQEFDQYARGVAKQLGPLMDWSRDSLPAGTDLDTWRGWLRMHPTNYWGLRKHAELAIELEAFDEAKRSLQTIDQLGGMTSERDGPLEWKVRVEQGLDDESARRRALSEVINRSSDALFAFEDLIRLAVQDERWEDAIELAEEAIGIQPLRADFHDALATAATNANHPHQAIESLQAVAALKPVDPIGNWYRLAAAYQQAGDASNAKKYVLQALEKAPRYRDALSLLLNLSENDNMPERDGDLPERKVDQKHDTDEVIRDADGDKS